MKYSPIAIAALVLAGCATSTTQRGAADILQDANARATSMGSQLPSMTPLSAVRGSAEHADRLAAEQLAAPVLRRSKATYIGSQMVPVTSDDKLPSIFRDQFNLFTDDRQVGRIVTLGTIANRITNSTKIPVRLQPDLMTLATNAPIGVTKPAGAGPDSADAAAAVMPLNVDIADLRSNGTLVSFLNSLTDRLGLAWEYRDNTVVIMRFVTESFEISALVGSQTFTVGGGGSSSSQTSSSQSAESKMTVTDGGSVDTFASMEKAVKDMISTVPGSTVVRSDGSKKLIVKTSREMLAQVRDYIAGENAVMKKQALIQFDVYSVQVTDGDEKGVNWNLIFNALSNVYGVNVGSPATLTSSLSATLGVSILDGTSETSRRLKDTTAFFNLLQQNGANVQHRIIPFIARNGTWARKSRLSTESYISETTPGASSITGPGTPGIKTEKVTTGDQYMILPQIMNNNSVMLKYSLSLSDLLGLTDISFGTGVNQQKIQTTKVSSNGESGDITLNPGQVMSITGLSRVVSTGDQRTLTEQTSIFFGGSKKTAVTREHFIIFVRPVIL